MIALIFGSKKKKKEKAQVKQQAAQETQRKEMRHLLAVHGGEQDAAIEARAQVAAETQQRTDLRAKMTYTERPTASVSGRDILLPNATSHSLATQGHVQNGVNTQVWFLGDGGHAALQLVAVDTLSLSNWVQAHAQCGIVYRIDDPFGDGGGGPAVARHIYAHPRLIYRTSNAGTALQPGWEVAKQTAQNLAGFVGPSNELVEGASALLAAGVEQHRMHHKEALSPAQKKLQKAKGVLDERKQDAGFRVDDAKVWVAIEFGIAPGKDGVQLGNGSWYFSQAHSQQWQQLTAALSKMWTGH